MTHLFLAQAHDSVDEAVPHYAFGRTFRHAPDNHLPFPEPLGGRGPSRSAPSIRGAELDAVIESVCVDFL